MAGSLLIIAIEALVSVGLGVPGSRGFINPTAVLGGVHCYCYLYLLLCSSSMESQLGSRSRDTEPWLPSKPGLRRPFLLGQLLGRTDTERWMEVGQPWRRTCGYRITEEEARRTRKLRIRQPLVLNLGPPPRRPPLPSPEWLTVPSWEPLSSYSPSLSPVLVTWLSCVFFCTTCSNCCN